MEVEDAYEERKQDWVTDENGKQCGKNMRPSRMSSCSWSHHSLKRCFLYEDLMCPYLKHYEIQIKDLDCALEHELCRHSVHCNDKRLVMSTEVCPLITATYPRF